MSLVLEGLFGLGAWRQETSEGRRRFGVPPGGPWDREAAMLCRALTGTVEDAPVFELLQGTATFVAEESLSISVVGVKGELDVNGTRKSLNRRVLLQCGDRIQVQARVAIIATSTVKLTRARLDWSPTAPDWLRFLPGRETEGFTAVVDPTRSRAGVRLNTEARLESKEQPSEPSCVGAIQSTPSGQLIVIGPDGPTIGGYPRIGTVIDADLDLIPRLEIGQTVRLTPVDLPSALRLADERRTQLNRYIEGLKIVRPAEML